MPLGSKFCNYNVSVGINLINVLKFKWRLWFTEGGLTPAGGHFHIKRPIISVTRFDFLIHHFYLPTHIKTTRGWQQLAFISKSYQGFGGYFHLSEQCRSNLVNGAYTTFGRLLDELNTLELFILHNLTFVPLN